MRLSVRELKNSFIAMCGRQANLSTGLTYFQDFEIATFLNDAYLICFDKKMGLYDPRYISVELRDKVNPANAFPNSMKALIDFGELYGASTMLTPVNAPASGTGAYQDTSAGLNAVFFNLPMINDITPYILNCNFYEFNDSYDKLKPQFSYACKPVVTSDVPKMSVVYSADRYMPYLYYRLRRAQDHDTKEDKDVLRQYLEIIYSSRSGKSDPVYRLSYDYVAFPEKITAAEIAENSDRVIEVTFGYDIATRAVQIAMESIGVARPGGTLAEVESKPL